MHINVIEIQRLWHLPIPTNCLDIKFQLREPLRIECGGELSPGFLARGVLDIDNSRIDVTGLGTGDLLSGFIDVERDLAIIGLPGQPVPSRENVRSIRRHGKALEEAPKHVSGFECNGCHLRA